MNEKANNVTVKLPIENRESAGLALAQALSPVLSGKRDVIVLALPRGGVPVAAQIAHTFDTELDLMIVRKLGLPRHRELAFGAIASGGIRVLNEDVIFHHGVSNQDIEAVTREEREELRRREKTYRGNRPQPRLQGRTVVLVDDGIATGATMSAAIDAIQLTEPAEVIVAVPVAPADTVSRLKTKARQVISLATPEPFFSIGQWYRDFGQTSDDEVHEILQQMWKENG